LDTNQGLFLSLRPLVPLVSRQKSSSVPVLLYIITPVSGMDGLSLPQAHYFRNKKNTSCPALLFSLITAGIYMGTLFPSVVAPKNPHESNHNPDFITSKCVTA
jgi:hypothetical protein